MLPRRDTAIGGAQIVAGLESLEACTPEPLTLTVKHRV
jgi:hypothetical protein